MRPGILCLLAACLLLVVLAPATAAPRTGVLTGQITREATTIQCIRAPCREPAAGLVLTILRDGLLVARPRTDLEGRFRLALLPGRYAIRNPRLGSDRTVRVVVGGIVRVDIRLGSTEATAGAATQPEG